MCGESSNTLMPYIFSSRITPACAGKVGLPRFPAAPAQDHPRVCGESLPALHRQLYLLGSPPRVRGKSAMSDATCLLQWITPACAGKVNFCRFDAACKKDHPRVCGESCIILTPFTYIIGSPPRVRGKFIVYLVVCDITGITPACAGKVYMSPEERKTYEDHPRVCGESA